MVFSPKRKSLYKERFDVRRDQITITRMKTSATENMKNMAVEQPMMMQVTVKPEDQRALRRKIKALKCKSYFPSFIY